MSDNNFKRFSEGIQIGPGLPADPASGEIGEIYHNTTSDLLRICISKIPLVWGDLYLQPGTVSNSILVWDDGANRWSENSELLINQNLITTPSSVLPNNIQLKPGIDTSASNNGQDVLLEGGDVSGTGEIGQVVVSGRSMSFSGVSKTSDPIVSTETDFYYNSVSKRFKYYDGTNWSLMSILPGSTVDAAIKWNGTDWVEESSVLISTNLITAPSDNANDAAPASDFSTRSGSKTNGTGDGGSNSLIAGASLDGTGGSAIVTAGPSNSNTGKGGDVLITSGGNAGTGDSGDVIIGPGAVAGGAEGRVILQGIEVYIPGKLTVDGGIDPEYLQLDPQAGDGAIPNNSIFIDSNDSNKLKLKDNGGTSTEIGSGGSAPKVLGGGEISYENIENVDAQNIPSPTSSIAWLDGNASFINGQSFLVTQGHELTKIVLRLSKTGSPTGVVKLNLFPCSFGAPHIVNGAQIGQTDGVNMSAITGSFTEFTFSFPTPIPVTAGQYYGFTYDFPSVISTNAGVDQIELENTNPGAYADGNYIDAVGGSGAFDYNFTAYTNTLSLLFVEDFVLEVDGLDYSDNTIPITESPILLLTNEDVAYVTPNDVAAGPALGVTVDTLPNVPPDAVIVARRKDSIRTTVSTVSTDSLIGVIGDPLNTTTLWRGQKFTTGIGGDIANVIFKLALQDGVIGNATVDVYSDSAGDPGSVIATSDPVDITSLPGVGFEAPVVFNFSTASNLSPATLYHAIINTSVLTFGGGANNRFFIARDLANPYAGGNSVHTSDSGGSWVNNAGTDQYFSVSVLVPVLNPEVVVGTSSDRLKIGETKVLYSTLNDRDKDKVYSEKSSYFVSDDEITWTGTDLQFTSDIELKTIKSDGTLQTYSVALADSPVTIADGEYVYLTINRAKDTEIVSLTVGAAPAESVVPTEEVVILATRQDISGVSYLHLPLSKQLIETGQVFRLGKVGVRPPVEASSTSVSYPITFDEWGSLTSFSLPKGKWALGLFINTTNNGTLGAATNLLYGISTTDGNSATGLVYGENRGGQFLASTVSGVEYSMSLPLWVQNVTAPTTYYLKAFKATSISGLDVAYKLFAQEIG